MCRDPGLVKGRMIIRAIFEPHLLNYLGYEAESLSASCRFYCTVHTPSDNRLTDRAEQTDNIWVYVREYKDKDTRMLEFVHRYPVASK